MQASHDDPRSISLGTVRRAVRMIQKVLIVNGVDRARDLPDEARVRLAAQLQRLLDADQARAWDRAFYGSFWNRWLAAVREGIPFRPFRLR